MFYETLFYSALLLTCFFVCSLILLMMVGLFSLKGFYFVIECFLKI